MNKIIKKIIIAAVVIVLIFVCIFSLEHKSSFSVISDKKDERVKDIWLEKKQFENNEVFCFYKIKIEGKYYYMVHKNNFPQYATLIRIEEQK